MRVRCAEEGAAGVLGVLGVQEPARVVFLAGAVAEVSDFRVATCVSCLADRLPGLKALTVAECCVSGVRALRRRELLLASSGPVLEEDKLGTFALLVVVPVATRGERGMRLQTEAERKP